MRNACCALHIIVLYCETASSVSRSWQAVMGLHAQVEPILTLRAGSSAMRSKRIVVQWPYASNRNKFLYDSENY
jgi:hypothetical protein